MGVISCGTTMLDQGVFENIGSVTWDTTAKTSGFTGVSGNGYFVNTTSAAITVTLPASPSAGDIIGIKDYANTADTNNITIARNGSPIQGDSADFIINTEGRSVLLVYVDGTQGWKVTSSSQASDIVSALFVTATGGTITTSGNFKIHTFTSPGTFTVSCAGNAIGSNTVDYMVTAGGGGGAHGAPASGKNNPDGFGGGGGAGGFRESPGAASGCYSVSPIAGGSALSVPATDYPITVGGGGSGGSLNCGTNGSNSVFSTITSAGGGGAGMGGANGSSAPGKPGGSGGGAGGRGPNPGGSGNQPPVSPPQGNNGGANTPSGSGGAGGGGGGATATGTSGTGGTGGGGGAGATTSINASPVTRAGGGGGRGSSANGSGGPGGGGSASGGAGSANTGGGGGGGQGGTIGGAGGSGIVIIRYKFQ